MHHDFIDRYSRLNSPVHRIPVKWKFTFTVLMIGILVIVPVTMWYLFCAAGIVLIFVGIISRIPWSFTLKRLLIFEPFIILIAVLTLFQQGGLIKFISIVTKSSLSLLTVIYFSNTTPFSELLAFLRTIRIPSIFVTVVALMYRYLFILVDETERIQRARMSRTFQKKKVSAWFILASVLGQLFVRSTERAERIYAAMCARGWK